LYFPIPVEQIAHNSQGGLLPLFSSNLACGAILSRYQVESEKFEYRFNNHTKMKKTLLLSAFALIMILPLAPSFAQVDVSLSIETAPPALPVYAQPECPGDGYMWTPGYWAYGPEGYYWVPGVWVNAPSPGLLWTPNYWGYDGGYYRWHPGYWGAQVGFYGGINYGFGYGGVGFGGGRWEGNSFRYNTAVVNVNTTVVHNTYVDRTVVNNTYENNHTSFNGRGGVEAKPTGQEQAAASEHHIAPTAEQNSHFANAGKDRSQLASVNKGRPATVAVATVGRNSNNQPEHHEAVAKSPAPKTSPNAVTPDKHSVNANPVQHTSFKPSPVEKPVARPAPLPAKKENNQSDRRPAPVQHQLNAPKPHIAPPQHREPPHVEAPREKKD
jgi:hypothetical protein